MLTMQLTLREIESDKVQTTKWEKGPVSACAYLG